MTLGAQNGKAFACNVGDLGSILGWEDLLEEGMEAHSRIRAWRIPMNRGAWQATVHGVAESDLTQLLGTTQHIANFEEMKFG